MLPECSGAPENPLADGAILIPSFRLGYLEGCSISIPRVEVGGLEVLELHLLEHFLLTSALEADALAQELPQVPVCWPFQDQWRCWW